MNKEIIAIVWDGGNSSNLKVIKDNFISKEDAKNIWKKII